MRAARSSSLAALFAVWAGAALSATGTQSLPGGGASVTADFVHHCVHPMLAAAALSPDLPVLPATRTTGTETGRHWAVARGAVLSELRSGEGTLDGCRVMLPAGQSASRGMLDRIAGDFGHWSTTSASASGLSAVSPCGASVGDHFQLLETEMPRADGNYLKVLMMIEAEMGLFLLTAAESCPAPHGC